jgi:hypothetical protein
MNPSPSFGANALKSGLGTPGFFRVGLGFAEEILRQMSPGEASAFI